MTAHVHSSRHVARDLADALRSVSGLCLRAWNAYLLCSVQLRWIFWACLFLPDWPMLTTLTTTAEPLG